MMREQLEILTDFHDFAIPICDFDDMRHKSSVSGN